MIQILLQLYNKDMYFDLTKTKALFMASTSKIAFNSLIRHSTLNIDVQQCLFSLSNSSSNSLNRFTCRYEQLQLVVIDEISLVGTRMFNFIVNMLRSIKHIIGGVDVIITNDFYQASLMKDNWIFQNIKYNINALTLNFWQTYV